MSRVHYRPAECRSRRDRTEESSMGWFSRKFGKEASVAYYTWHVGPASGACAACRERDGQCWLPERTDVVAPPLKTGCTCPGGCKCRALVVATDEAWGPGNAEWIKKRGGFVTAAQMSKFLSS
ncbi:MAG: hypothetical protein ACT4PU_07395 [Planctomycetota bacterium]